MVTVVCHTNLKPNTRVTTLSNVLTFKTLFSPRFLVNFSITFGFFGFWHVALYLLHWSDRPFQPGRSYRVGKVVGTEIQIALNIK